MESLKYLSYWLLLVIGDSRAVIWRGSKSLSPLNRLVVDFRKPSHWWSAQERSLDIFLYFKQDQVLEKNQQIHNVTICSGQIVENHAYWWLRVLLRRISWLLLALVSCDITFFCNLMGVPYLLSNYINVRLVPCQDLDFVSMHKWKLGSRGLMNGTFHLTLWRLERLLWQCGTKCGKLVLPLLKSGTKWVILELWWMLFSHPQVCLFVQRNGLKMQCNLKIR